MRLICIIFLFSISAQATGTRVCTGLDDLGRELVRLRRLTAAAAVHLGCPLVASGVAVPHARAGRLNVPAPLPGAGTPVCSVPWWPMPAPAPATCTSGSPPGTWASRSWRGCGPGLRRCSPSPPTPRSPTGTIPDGPAGGTRSSHAGRPRCRPRCGRTRLPTTRQSAASSGAARRWTRGASTSWPGFPRATRPSRSGSPTSASTLAPRSCGGADPRPGRHRPSRGPPRDAGGSRAAPAGRRGPGRCGAAGASRGRSRPVHRAGRRCADAPLPPPRLCLPRAQRPRRHRDDHQVAAPARPAGDRSRPPASPVHQRRIHARVHHRARPRDAVRPRGPATSRAAGACRCPGPGSGRREPGAAAEPAALQQFRRVQMQLHLSPPWNG